MMKEFFFDIETLDINYLGEWPIILRLGILLGLGLGSLFFGHQLWLENTWLSLKASKNQCQALQQELQNINMQFKDQHSYELELQKITKALEILLRQLPNKNEEAKILEALAALALQCRLQIRTVKPQAEIHKEKYVEYPIHISLLGDYHGLGEFVSRFSNMSPMVTLQEYTLQNNKNSPLLEMQLLLKTYVLPNAVEN